MKRSTLLFTFIVIALTAFAQRRTTTVRGYYREDGTYVNSHTRHYNSGGSSSSSNYYSEGISPRTNYLSSRSYNVADGNDTISKSDLKPGRNTNKILKRIDNLSINPSILISDTSGVTIYLAVLRYNDTSVIDICPLTRDILTYEIQSSLIYYKIPKDKIKPEHIIELVSRYGFDLKNDYLLKREYLGIVRPDFPDYLSLKLEALTLR